MKPEQGEDRTVHLNKPVKQRGQSDKGTVAESTGMQRVINAPLPCSSREGFCSRCLLGAQSTDEPGRETSEGKTTCGPLSLPKTS